MLILNRRHGEAILLDGGIRIIVLSSDKRGVRLGIEAPPEVNIQREELVSEVAAQNRRASAGTAGAAWLVQLPLKGAPR
jgi:carbon storage regulator CsrA